MMRSADLPPSGRVLRLEPGSCARPLLTVLWGEDPVTLAVNEREQATLGANRACWPTSHEGDDWHRLARPLPSWARLGSPAATQPWVLVAPELRVGERLLTEITGLHHPQPHFLRPTARAGAQGGVVWLPTSRIIESLLGHVDAVLAPNGPLAWDAKRAGTPVFEMGDGAPPDLGLRRLARVVPEDLVGEPSFWRTLVSNLLDGSGTSSWGTLPWLRLTRAHWLGRSASPTARLARKLQKLRQDPAGFWADSKLAKLAGFRGK